MEVLPFTLKVAQEPIAALPPRPFASHSPGESLGTRILTHQAEDLRAESLSDGLRTLRN